MDDHHKFTAHFIVLPGKLCLQATLFTFMSGRRRKIPPSSNGGKGKRGWGVKIMGPTQSALFRVPSATFGASDPPSASVCVFFLPLFFPLPLRLLVSFLPSSAVFLREQRGPGALAAPHSSTSLRSQITHFPPPRSDLRFGEVEGHHFSFLPSASNTTLAGAGGAACGIRFHGGKTLSSADPRKYSGSKSSGDELKLRRHLTLFSSDFEARKC